MNRLSRIALWAGGLALAVAALWTLVKVEQIADRVSVRPVSVDQMREIVLDAMGKEGGGMLMTPVTVNGVTHEVTTRYREPGHETETEDEFQDRHIERCRKYREKLEKKS